MGYIKYLIFTSLCFAGQEAAQTCRVDRNEYNRYPFVVRIVFDGQMRAHGSLVAPYRVLSAYNALADVYNKKPLWPKLKFTMHVFSKDGAVKCTIDRKLKLISTPVDKSIRNMAFLLLESGFPVTLNLPFVFNRLETVNKTVVDNILNGMKNKESCAFPAFNSQNPSDTKLTVDRLSFLKGNATEQARWRELACKDDPECKKPYFFAVDPLNRLPGFAWYKGAVIICRDIPLGIFSKVVEDPSSNERIIAFEGISRITQNLLVWCVREWPKPPPTKTTVSTSRKPTQKTTIPLTTTKSRIATSTSPETTVSTTTRTTSTLPTYASSLIPKAPQIANSPATPKTTVMFIRTKPRHARFLNGNIRTTSPIHATLLNCSAYLILKYMLF